MDGDQLPLFREVSLWSVNVYQVYHSRVYHVGEAIFLRRLNGARFRHVTKLPLYFRTGPAGRVLSRVRGVCSKDQFNGASEFRNVRRFRVAVRLNLRLSSQRTCGFYLGPFHVVGQVYVPSQRLFSYVVLFAIGLVVYPSKAFNHCFPKDVTHGRPFLSVFVMCLGLNGRFECVGVTRSQRARQDVPSITRSSASNVDSLWWLSNRVGPVVLRQFKVVHEHEDRCLVSGLLSIGVNLVGSWSTGMRNDLSRFLQIRVREFTRVANDSSHVPLRFVL